MLRVLNMIKTNQLISLNDFIPLFAPSTRNEVDFYLLFESPSSFENVANIEDNFVPLCKSSASVEDNSGPCFESSDSIKDEFPRLVDKSIGAEDNLRIPIEQEHGIALFSDNSMNQGIDNDLPSTAIQL